MNEQTLPIAPASRASKLLATFAKSKLINIESLLKLRRFAIDDKTDLAPFRELVDQVIDNVDDDTLIAIFADAKARREDLVASLDWVAAVAENGFMRRLQARRGPESTEPISIAHPILEVTLNAQFGPYRPDVDALETVLPQLDEEDQKKLLVITPEREVPEQIIPAHTVPRSVQPGATVSILAIAKRFRSSTVGTVITNAMKRERDRDKLTIKIKKAALEQKNVTPESATLTVPA